VESVSWNDAVAYCATLTQRERSAGRIGTNSVYRLPTEAEWEYACRGWTSTRFSYGDDPGYTNLTNYAWYILNSDCASHPVGQKLPNPWGLYDMHGNVSEWCQDWYGNYAGGIAVDPQGPATGSARVVRGGGWVCWSGFAGGCRSAGRCCDGPCGWGDYVGFRVLLAPGQPAFAPPALPQVLTGPVTNAATEHLYYLLTESTWTAAEAKAVELGGHLVTINDEAENHWVFDTFANYGGIGRGLWIGLTYRAREGEFEWVDGSPVSFTRWAAGEPNNTDNNEDYAYIFYPQDTAGRAPGWNDSPDASGIDASSSGYGWIPFNGVVEVWEHP